MNEIYKEQQAQTPEVYRAFMERIKNIIRFTAFRVWHYELKDGKCIEPVPPPKQLKVADLKPIDDGDLPF